MTALEAIIRRQIAGIGPMSLHDYMALCLGHPEHGYYITRDPLGRGGDFVTAPEVSQMFGELLGLSLAQSWLDQGSPARIVLAELGPGRGRLMADVLRAARNAPGFRDAAEVWLVETSPVLRTEQARHVPGARWAEHLNDLPDAPLFLLANEFFDALPIRQYHRQRGAWWERVVGIEEDKLTFGLQRSALPLGVAEDGTVRERCPAASAIIGDVATRIARRGGAAIIVDYGYDQPVPLGADTLQAVCGHGYADPLDSPGEADLTAHVDFGALADAATGAATSALITQRDLLIRLGIGARAAALAAKGDAAKIEADLRRLTDPDQMGTLFKALAIHPIGAPPPAGFDPR
ncbi:MAG: SAM-dependent methyltransferase [Pseudomonadota bacterium]